MLQHSGYGLPSFPCGVVCPSLNYDERDRHVIRCGRGLRVRWMEFGESGSRCLVEMLHQKRPPPVDVPVSVAAGIAAWMLVFSDDPVTRHAKGMRPSFTASSAARAVSLDPPE
jgi:hypothetical protein